MARKKKNKNNNNNEVVAVDIINNSNVLNDENGQETISDENREKEVIVVKKVVRKHNKVIEPSEPLKDKVNNLDKTKKLIICAVLALLLLLGFVFGILPLLKKAVLDLNTIVETMKKQLIS